MLVLTENKKRTLLSYLKNKQHLLNNIVVIMLDTIVFICIFPIDINQMMQIYSLFQWREFIVYVHPKSHILFSWINSWGRKICRNPIVIESI